VRNYPEVSTEKLSKTTKILRRDGVPVEIVNREICEREETALLRAA
jgi:hypothetical protein